MLVLRAMVIGIETRRLAAFPACQPTARAAGCLEPPTKPDRRLSPHPAFPLGDIPLCLEQFSVACSHSTAATTSFGLSVAKRSRRPTQVAHLGCSSTSPLTRLRSERTVPYLL